MFWQIEFLFQNLRTQIQLRWVHFWWPCILSNNITRKQTNQKYTELCMRCWHTTIRLLEIITERMYDLYLPNFFFYILKFTTSSPFKVRVPRGTWDHEGQGGSSVPEGHDRRYGTEEDGGIGSHLHPMMNCICRYGCSGVAIRFFKIFGPLCKNDPARTTWRMLLRTMLFEN